jgi:hypothetical protein
MIFSNKFEPLVLVLRLKYHIKDKIILKNEPFHQNTAHSIENTHINETLNIRISMVPSNIMAPQIRIPLHH